MLKKLLKIPKWILYILLVLIIIRIFLPVAGKYAVNWYLGNQISPYRGEIVDFDLSLHRGAYQFEGLVIEKYREKENRLDPLLRARHIDVSLSWRALFKRKILGDLVIDGAQVTFLDSQKKENAQSGQEGNLDWKQVFITLVPIKIETLQIRNSSVVFKNNDFKKPVDVRLSQISLAVTNINNSERDDRPIFSRLDFKAKLQDHSDIEVAGLFDILAKVPEFDLAFQMRNFDLTTINDLLLAYGPLSFTRGKVSVYSELATLDSKATGYVKVFLKNIDVIANREVFGSIKHLAIEIVSAIGNLFLRNSKEKEVAFRVPIKGPITNLSISTKEAFLSALDNAFDSDPIEEGLEKSISLQNVK